MRAVLGTSTLTTVPKMRAAIEQYSNVMDSAILGALLRPTVGNRYDWDYVDQRQNNIVYPISGTFSKGGWYAFNADNDLYNGKPVYRNTWAEPVRLWYDGSKWIISDSSTVGDTDCDYWYQQEANESLVGSTFIAADTNTETGTVGIVLQPELVEYDLQINYL